MALLSYVDSTPRAYRLKAGNAARKVSTDAGTSPRRLCRQRIKRKRQGFPCRSLRPPWSRGSLVLAASGDDTNPGQTHQSGSQEGE